MVEIATTAAAVGAIKTAFNALKDLKELGLSAKHAAVVDAAMDDMREAQNQLNNVQGEILELREENHALKRTIANHDNWQDRFDQHALVQTPGGAQVYQGGEPPNNYYACPACIEHQKIQILQTERSMSGRWSCPSCNTKFPVDPPQTMRSSSRGGGGEWG
jgi:hypothetical protein